jgi:hypothetical protein
MVPLVSPISSGENDVAHDDFAGRGDVGELRLHFRALVVQLERIDAAPGLVVFGE